MIKIDAPANSWAGIGVDGGLKPAETLVRGMAEPERVVTCFLRNQGEILLVRRADSASTYGGRWAGISGYVEQEDPIATARMEIREETQLTNAVLVRRGDPLSVSDAESSYSWVVHPFLFDSASREVVLNEEAAAADWVPATEILRRQTVPGLWEAYRRVRPTPETIAEDEAHGSAYLSLCSLEVLRDTAGEVAEQAGNPDEIRATARDLLAARPSMAVVRNRVNRVMADAETPAQIEAAAIAAIERALEADHAAAETTAAVLPETVFTLSRSGTVTEALLASNPQVTIAESRPACEGTETAEHLADAGLSVTLCTDAATAQLLAERDIEAVVVGADTILPDGHVVNKTGTRAAALAAAKETIPVYVAVSSDKVSIDSTAELENTRPTDVYDGPAPIDVFNPAFDITPPELITAYCTETGRLQPDDLPEIVADHRERADWHQQ